MFTRDHIHHAYIIEGEREAVLLELFRLLKKELSIERQGNPDLFHEEFDVFGIDDGRRVKEMSSNAAFTGTKKIFVIATRSITNEAQNSLLKVFEEPTPNTHFFIVMPVLTKLLPTFRSRALIIRHDSAGKAGDDVSAGEFVSAAPAKRLTLLKGIVESKDKGKAEAFLRALALHLKKDGVKSLDEKKAAALGEISKALSYIGDRSSSVKLLLEHIALSL